jgi:UDP-N-acetylmuramoyl-L-alanyl-D-glutamate--2,6-diaminopimelate ligase
MGQVAGSLSDLVVLTNDNPRTEDPAAIASDALAGLEKTRAERYVELDRAKAIAAAIGAAHEGDIVILAGKGHEDYQITGTKKTHFDDREVARAALKQLGYESARGGLPRMNTDGHG